MSICESDSSPSLELSAIRKRPSPSSSSYSTAKKPRLMPELRRTESCLALSLAPDSNNRPRRQRQKAIRASFDSCPDPFAYAPSLPLPPLPVYTPPRPSTQPVSIGFRTNSPLSPTQTVLPARPVFPRSKAEPDLYRKAITTRMRCTPEGQKILHMGPRLAVSIIAATKELERIVAAQAERDRDWEGDVLMEDTPSAPSALSNSWVMVPGEDWEMIDCGA